MDPFVLGIGSFVVLTALLLTGMRIAFATLLCGFVGLWLMRGYQPAANLTALSVFGHSTSYELLVLPLFVMMGFFAYHAGITRDLFWASKQWFGHWPGGLAIATVIGSAGFAAACGASTAAAAVMGRVALPELKKFRYDDRVSFGCVAAGGTIAVMIPPSVLLVVYGYIAEESVGVLLLAGILPGLLQALSYSLMLYLRFKFNPALGPPITIVSWSERWRSLKNVWRIMLLILCVMGSIYAGIATPTECAALGALGSLAISAPNLSRQDFWSAMVETVRTTSMIFAIVAGVMVYVHFLGFTGMPAAIADWVANQDLSPTIVLIMILAMYLILGMFVDGLGMMLLTVPILMPTIHQLGTNPIVFGILLVRMIEIGLITPPVGLNVYVLKSIAPDADTGLIFRGCGWFVAIDIINVAILLTFPSIILAIPSMMRS